MTDLTATVSLSGIRDITYDDSRGLLYLSDSDGRLYRWNPLTSAFLAPVTLVTPAPIEGGPSGVALTPDGQYALVGEFRPTGEATDGIYRLNLSTLTVEALTLPLGGYGPASGVENIGINQSGIAVESTRSSYYFEESQTVHQFASEGSTLSFSNANIPNQYYGAGDIIVALPNSNLVLIKDTLVDHGFLSLYDPGSHTVVYSTPFVGIDPALAYASASVISRIEYIDAYSVAAGRIVDLNYDNAHVYDLHLNVVADISQYAHASDAEFSADGRQLFLLQGHQILVLDTQRWTQVATLDLGSQVFGHKMDASADGRMLFVTTTNSLAVGTGFEAFDLKAQLHLTIQGDGVHTQLTGAIGDDMFISSSANEIMDGAGGINTVSYATASSGVTVSLALQGQAQDTTGGGIDTLSNIQNLIGSAFADHLTGDANDNVIAGGGGDDVLDGGGGNNTVSYASAPAGVAVSLALQNQLQDTLAAGHDVLTNFQNIIGSAFNDTLEGDANDNVLDGGGGTNTLSYAHASSGVVVSLALQGEVQDTVGAGRDTLSNFQNILGSAFGDTLTGDANNNVIDGGGGNDVLDGGGGVNTVSYASASAGVTVNLALQGQSQDTIGGGHETLSHFQNIVGSAFDDVLTGDANNNVIDGGGGSNVLDGGGGINTVSYAHATAGVTVSLALAGHSQDTIGAGHDTLSNFQNIVGSAFNDTLEGDGGANVLDGAGGINTVSYAHSTAGVVVNLAAQGAVQDTLGAGTDTLSNFQNVVGGAFNDVLIVSAVLRPRRLLARRRPRAGAHRGGCWDGPGR